MRTVGFVLFVLLATTNVASSQRLNDEPGLTTVYGFCQQFQSLYIRIREQTITPDAARRDFRRVMLGLRQRFQADSVAKITARLAARTDTVFRADTLLADSLAIVQFKERQRVADSVTIGQVNQRATRARFVFPIRGYGPTAIGGTHGEGYLDRGFDLFDYKVRGSHPAQDIFIADRNQDCLDDRTGRPVDVLAMRPGLVLAIETDWKPGSEYRGGNWIWVYDPALNGLFYYAHNRVVKVSPGQWVQSGDKISEMGRTGFNAYKSRSPTHLHLMYLQLRANGMPLPNNTYGWLLAASRQ
jgi:peptidoglycan LD-endopeptidase LytH